MSKKKITSIIVIAMIGTLLLNVLVGRWLSAEISTLPFLNHLKLLSPQAPIVINNREEVRVDDSTDVIQAASSIESKLSTIVIVQNGQVVTTGGAVNLTSDGMFFSVAGAFPVSGATYYVILNDGRQAPITQLVSDPATNLVFFQAALTGVPVSPLGNSGDLQTGQKVIFLLNSTQSFSAKFLESFVTADQGDQPNQLFDADRPARSFMAQPVTPLLPGEAIVDTGPTVCGIWDGSSIISADVIQKAVGLYLSQPSKISRPSYGFTYLNIVSTDSALLKIPVGALVKSVKPQSPAQAAGLLAGDVITQIDSQSVDQPQTLEQLLQSHQPGDSIPLTVTRSTNTLHLILTAGTLK